ncbi:VENN motif pre-toxin domain-containing protein [Xenorhabdus indica]|uniref:VENN motif pre-toxin domain-containing protein n=1 Tax=Xenorhabdus indica TaxID=333964 RepID=UPI003B84A995
MIDWLWPIPGETSGRVRRCRSVGYPGKTFSELTPDEKEKISNLSTLAGGIAAGLATNSTAGGIDGAQTARMRSRITIFIFLRR